jgi:hypothetical protein
VCIVHFLVSFLRGKFSDVICHAALHQHIVVIVGIFYSLNFCTHSFFLFSIFFPCLHLLGWVQLVHGNTLCAMLSIVISEQVLNGHNCSFFKIKYMDAIALEVALDLLRYPQTLVCSLISLQIYLSLIIGYCCTQLFFLFVRVTIQRTGIL